MSVFFFSQIRTHRVKLYCVICLSFFILLSGNSAIAEPGGGSTGKDDLNALTEALCDLYQDLSIEPDDPELCQWELSERIIFITHNGYRVELDFVGIEEANRACQREARDAGLPGTYLAWISDTSVMSSPNYRFEHSSDPYVRIDGARVANDWYDLTDGWLYYPITICPQRHEHSGAGVWTNTTLHGNPQEIYAENGSCSHWQEEYLLGYGNTFAVSGLSGETTPDWTTHSTVSCHDTAYKFYCVQQAK